MLQYVAFLMHYAFVRPFLFFQRPSGRLPEPLPCASSRAQALEQLPKPRSKDFPVQVALNTKIFQLSGCFAPKTWCFHRRLPNLQLSHIFSAWAARSLTPSSSVTCTGDGDPGNHWMRKFAATKNGKDMERLHTSDASRSASHSLQSFQGAPPEH